jgi:hypothetical protein
MPETRSEYSITPWRIKRNGPRADGTWVILDAHGQLVALVRCDAVGDLTAVANAEVIVAAVNSYRAAPAEAGKPECAKGKACVWCSMPEPAAAGKPAEDK